MARIIIRRAEIIDTYEMLLHERDRVFSDHDLIAKCCRNLLRIDSRNQIVPLLLNATQDMIIDAFVQQRKASLPCRLVVLKGRQQGSSTGVAARIFLDLISRDNVNALLSSETKGGSALNVWDMYLNFVRYFPILPSDTPLRDRLLSCQDGKFFRLLNRSRLRVEGQGDVLSFTTDVVHISEAGYFDRLQSWMARALPGTEDRHDTVVVVESTVEKAGDGFHDLWNRAKSDDFSYHPVFAPWYVHERNKTNIPELRRERIVSSFGKIERYGNELELKDEYGLSNEQLLFRRNRIDVTNVLEFQREYPSTAEEAFLIDDRPVLDTRSLTWMRERCKKADMDGAMIPDERETRYDGTENAEFKSGDFSPVEIWESPIPFEQYVAGSDHAVGKFDGGWNAGLIARRNPFKIVAKLRGTDYSKLEAIPFARQWYYLLRWYNNADWLAENNHNGSTIIDVLYDWKYRNIMLHREVFGGPRENKTKGWSNNISTRDRVVSMLIDAFTLEFNKDGEGKFVSELTPVIEDEETISELSNLIYNNGKAEAKRKGEHRKRGESQIGFYDDLVFALAGVILAQKSLPRPLSKEGNMLRKLGPEHYLTMDFPQHLKDQYSDKSVDVASENAWRGYL